MPRYSEKAYEEWERAVSAIEKVAGNVTAEDRAAVAWFLAQTPDEDLWLNRTQYLDGSPAAMMRNILATQSSTMEMLSALDFHLTRPALKAFANAVYGAGEAFPEHLRLSAKVSIRFWKLATQWADRGAMA